MKMQKTTYIKEHKTKINKHTEIKDKYITENNEKEHNTT